MSSRACEHRTPITVQGQRRVGAGIWSPDGSALWYNKSRDGVYARSMGTQDDVKLIDYRADGVLSLSCSPTDCLRVSPDGRWLAYRGFLRSSPETLVLKLKDLNAPGPSRELLRAKQPDRFTLLPWSPDSRELLIGKFSMGSRNQEVYRLPIGESYAPADGLQNARTVRRNLRRWAVDDVHERLADHRTLDDGRPPAEQIVRTVAPDPCDRNVRGPSGIFSGSRREPHCILRDDGERASRY